MTLHIVQEEAADEVLSTNSFALLCGMVLHQQVSLEVAFAGPAKILDRFGTLDPKAIGEAPKEEFAELCAAEPAVHPYPETMAELLQSVAKHIDANYEGETSSIWTTAGSGEHLLSRLMLVPGLNKRRAQMFVALLGKQLDVRPDGWEKAAGPFAKPGIFRSVADVHDPESLEKVRGTKGSRSGDENADDARAASASGPGHKGAKKAAKKGAKKSAKKAAKKSAKHAATTGAAATAATDTPERRARRAAKKAAAAQSAAESTASEDDSATASADTESGDGGQQTTGRGTARRGGKRAAKKAAATPVGDEVSQASDPDEAAGGGRRPGAGGRPGRGRKRADTRRGEGGRATKQAQRARRQQRRADAAADAGGPADVDSPTPDSTGEAVPSSAEHGVAGQTAPEGATASGTSAEVPAADDASTGDSSADG